MHDPAHHSHPHHSHPHRAGHPDEPHPHGRRRSPGRGERRFNRWDRPPRGWGHGPGRRGGGRGRMRRGDIRTAILAVLGDRPGHGYDLMGRLEAKSGGAWRPSAGSVYPTLQQLEDEGLVTGTERDGKRVFTVTDAGREEARRRIEEAGAEPWAAVGGDGGVHPGLLFRSLGTLGMAAKQVVAAGTAAQLAAAVAVVDNARRELYRLLGDDTTADATDPTAGTATDRAADAGDDARTEPPDASDDARS